MLQNYTLQQGKGDDQMKSSNLLLLLFISMVIIPQIAIAGPGRPFQELEEQIQAEAAAREEADQDLQEKIDSERNSRMLEDSLIRDAINSEETARTDADTNLQEQVDECKSELNSLTGRITALEAVVGIINEPPTVSAGGDQNVLLSWSPTLYGSASDDGILDPLTTTWTKEIGPGNAEFANVFEASTTVQFDEIGDYTLRLTASDGIVTVFDEVNVSVFVDNDEPEVDAGPDKTVTADEEDGPFHRCNNVQLEGTASDDDLPETFYTYWFGPNSSPVATTFTDRYDPTTNVNIIVGSGSSLGGYSYADATLTLWGTDGFFEVTDTVTIRCQRP
jgi:hypothetical protein